MNRLLTIVLSFVIIAVLLAVKKAFHLYGAIPWYVTLSVVTLILYLLWRIRLLADNKAEKAFEE